MRAEHRSSRWENLSQSALIVVLAAVPVSAIIRYRWPQVLLFVGAALGIIVLSQRLNGRAVLALIAKWLWNLPGMLCLLLAAWTWASLAWAPDIGIAAMTNARAALAVGSAFTIAMAATILDRQRLFAAVIFCTVLASFGTIVTATTHGALHYALGCCKSGVQPEMSGAAAVLAQFIPICIGWLILTKRLRMAIAMFVLGCCVIAVSRSGASGLAFAAGILTVGVGLKYPRLAITFPLIIILFGFATALQLTNLGSQSWAPLIGKLAPFHAEDRIRIWAFYSELFWQRPWLGFGIGAEQFLGVSDNAKIFTPTMAPPNANLHPHNEPLQVLLEFGIIGAALLILALISITVNLQRGANFRTAVAVAPAAAFGAAALVNFGIWEWWWISCTAIASICSFQIWRYGSTLEAIKSYRATLNKPATECRSAKS